MIYLNLHLKVRSFRRLNYDMNVALAASQESGAGGSSLMRIFFYDSFQ